MIHPSLRVKTEKCRREKDWRCVGKERRFFRFGDFHISFTRWFVWLIGVNTRSFDVRQGVVSSNGVCLACIAGFGRKRREVWVGGEGERRQKGTEEWEQNKTKGRMIMERRMWRTYRRSKEWFRRRNWNKTEKSDDKKKRQEEWKQEKKEMV
jgi:hypothetical protein